MKVRFVFIGLVFSFLILGFDSYAATSAQKGSNSLKLTNFIKVVSRCLKSNSVNCLEKRITPELSFPEHITFGCQTERAGKITPYEFALCAIKSKVKCTDKRPKIKPMTLNAVLKECFTSLKAVGSEDQIVIPDGYVCRLEDVNHELFISSVAIQDHLTGFEEAVGDEDHRVKEIKSKKYDF